MGVRIPSPRFYPLMAKQDLQAIPVPRHPPRKRYQLENEQKIPDLWLAMWTTDTGLSDDERERVQAERDRRKALKPDQVVGLLLDREGISGPQLDRTREILAGLKPTAIHHPWAASQVHSACLALDVPVVVHKDVRNDAAPLREVVLASMFIIAAPRKAEDFRNRTPAWEAAQYARHRKLPVTVVLPDGTVQGG